ncbi:MAG: DUF3109 family protein [Flavobacteriaceae bacterium]
MFQIGKTIVSEDIIENEFVCNLSACKGECCIAGEAGAPLDEDEVAIMEEIFPKVKPFLRPEGIEAIEKQGTTITTDFGDLETPLINDAECAYVIFDDKNTALCGIEAAYLAGEISWKKPISCHLYPVRVQNYSSFSAVNYHRWSICSDACALGEELQVPTYKFLKDPLIRKFGKEWYDELQIIAENHIK